MNHFLSFLRWNFQNHFCCSYCCSFKTVTASMAIEVRLHYLQQQFFLNRWGNNFPNPSSSKMHSRWNSHYHLEVSMHILSLLRSESAMEFLPIFWSIFLSLKLAQCTIAIWWLFQHLSCNEWGCNFRLNASGSHRYSI